jgi:histidinol-phosphate aminotransferase
MRSCACSTWCARTCAPATSPRAAKPAMAMSGSTPTNRPGPIRPMPTASSAAIRIRSHARCARAGRAVRRAPEQLLVGRGSDEAIDLLVRALCAPGQDAIADRAAGVRHVCGLRTPAGRALIEVPLVDGEHGLVAGPAGAIGDAAWQRREAGVPVHAGQSGRRSLAADRDRALAQRCGKALVVVDEAYAEFADVPSATTLLAAHIENIAVLRTLSKAHALAAARIGVRAGGDPALIECCVAARRRIRCRNRCRARAGKACRHRRWPDRRARRGNDPRE